MNFTHFFGIVSKQRNKLDVDKSAFFSKKMLRVSDNWLFLYSWWVSIEEKDVGAFCFLITEYQSLSQENNKKSPTKFVDNYLYNNGLDENFNFCHVLRQNSRIFFVYLPCFFVFLQMFCNSLTSAWRFEAIKLTIWNRIIYLLSDALLFSKQQLKCWVRSIFYTYL